MKYKDIKEFTQRCEEHPDHQSGMISYGMIQQRLSEEIDELREYIEQRQWVGLTDEDKQIAFDDTQEGGGFWEFADAIEATLRKKNHG